MSASTERTWQQLETDAAGQATGFARRRIHQDSIHDLWLALDLSTRHRQLIHRRPGSTGRPPELPQSRAVTAGNLTLPGGGIETTITLLDPNFAEVFTTLVDDVSTATAATANHPTAAAALAARLWHWKQLLEGLSDTGLSPQARRGLAGELLVLTDLIDDGVPCGKVIRGWTGPSGANQDLQIGQHAVEIKTGSGRQPANLSISSERQLDDTGLASLHLVHVFLDERPGGTGTSLNRLVDHLRDTARQHPPADTELNDRLHLAGYLPVHHHLYDEPRYTVRSLRSYQVTEGFPRITEPLPTGVGNVRYDITISSCTPFEVPAAQLADRLRQATETT